MASRDGAIQPPGGLVGRELLEKTFHRVGLLVVVECPSFGGKGVDGASWIGDLFRHGGRRRAPG